MDRHKDVVHKNKKVLCIVSNFTGLSSWYSKSGIISSENNNL